MANEDDEIQHKFIIAESRDGMRVGMSVETFTQYYQDAGYRAVAGVGDDGKEHPHANIVKELNSVQKSTTATETNETGDGGTTTNEDASDASQDE